MNLVGSRSPAAAGGSSLALLCLIATAHTAFGGCVDRNRHTPGTILASWYGREHHGQPTASGPLFDELRLTAAHPWLPFGSRVRVTNVANRRSVIVTVTDRGPGYGRGIDISEAAARALGMIACGLASVHLALEETTNALHGLDVGSMEK